LSVSPQTPIGIHRRTGSGHRSCIPLGPILMPTSKAKSAVDSILHFRGTLRAFLGVWLFSFLRRTISRSRDWKIFFSTIHPVYFFVLGRSLVTYQATAAHQWTDASQLHPPPGARERSNGAGPCDPASASVRAARLWSIPGVDGIGRALLRSRKTADVRRARSRPPAPTQQNRQQRSRLAGGGGRENRWRSPGSPQTVWRGGGFFCLRGLKTGRDRPMLATVSSSLIGTGARSANSCGCSDEKMDECYGILGRRSSRAGARGSIGDSVTSRRPRGACMATSQDQRWPRSPKFRVTSVAAWRRGSRRTFRPGPARSIESCA